MHARVLSRFRSFLHFTTITIATATTTTITKKMRHFFRFSPISLYNLKQYILYKCLYSLGAHSSMLSLFFSLSLWSPKLPLPACTPTHQSRNLRGRRELPPARRTKRKENGNEKKRLCDLGSIGAWRGAEEGEVAAAAVAAASCFTCSRTGPRGAWCCPCGSRGGSCTCRDPGGRSRGGSCRWPSPWCRPARGPGPA